VFVNDIIVVYCNDVKKEFLQRYKYCSFYDVPHNNDVTVYNDVTDTVVNENKEKETKMSKRYCLRNFQTEIKVSADKKKL
jgi:hypothetical protein